MLCCVSLRHVSRTLRVALDWLFDRINSDPKIQIREIDTKHKLADMLTEGNFTRDVWNNLLQLFNISHFSSICCTKNLAWQAAPQTRRGFNIWKMKKELCPSRDQQWWIYLLPWRQVLPPHRVRLHPSSAIQGASRRRKFRRLRQSCGWNLVLQRRTRCPKQ